MSLIGDHFNGRINTTVSQQFVSVEGAPHYLDFFDHVCHLGCNSQKEQISA
jgi:hypothetical protein